MFFVFLSVKLRRNSLTWKQEIAETDKIEGEP